MIIKLEWMKWVGFVALPQQAKWTIQCRNTKLNLLTANHIIVLLFK
jgi:hypothetical protein